MLLLNGWVMWKGIGDNVYTISTERYFVLFKWPEMKFRELILPIFIATTQNICVNFIKNICML